jgi:hypothetical protein
MKAFCCGLPGAMCDDSGISRNGVSLLSGGSGRLDTRLDTPPSTKTSSPRFRHSSGNFHDGPARLSPVCTEASGHRALSAEARDCNQAPVQRDPMEETQRRVGRTRLPTAVLARTTFRAAACASPRTDEPAASRSLTAVPGDPAAEDTFRHERVGRDRPPRSRE